MLNAVDTPEKIGPVPDQPKTKGRSIRIDEPEWKDLGALVANLGTDRSKLINQLLDWWLRRDGAELPEQPDSELIERVVKARLEAEAASAALAEEEQG